MSSLQIVADKWSRLDPDAEKGFFGFPPLRPYLIETAFGAALAERHKANRYWAEDIVVSEYLQHLRIRNVLSLCCGFGVVERRIVTQLAPQVESCLGIDIAAGALDVARQRAAAEGLQGVLSYQVADLNSYCFPERKYDLIIANGALHHLRNLEGVLAGVRRALTARGVLYANEHVGASYQDYPARQLELINAAAYLVPPELRERRGHAFRLRHRFLNRISAAILCLTADGDLTAHPRSHPSWSPWKKCGAAVLRRLAPRRKPDDPEPFRFGIVHDSRKADFLRSDPSECVRSAEIIPVMRRHFDSVHVASFGGGILAYALDEQFYRRFDADNPLHQRTLAVLCALERHFTATGELGLEHAIIIAGGDKG